MIRRYLQEPILESLKYFPVVLLTGARQVGKSTLAQGLIGPSWKAQYYTLDDLTVLGAALRDPEGFVSGIQTPAVIDEVQRAPDLLLAIKRAVDRERKPGKFLLTGSANIMTLANVSETLAGRVAVHTLYPFGWPEFLEKDPPTILKKLFDFSPQALIQSLPKTFKTNYRKQMMDRMLTGGYPPPSLIPSGQARAQWFSSYRQTYLERDLLNIKSIEHLPDFDRLLSLVAFRTGRLLNLSDLSREIGLPFSTLRRYMNLLEVTYQIYYLRPYFSHLGKRLVKTPKLYCLDTGMACHLMGTEDWSVLEKQGQAGAIAETWAASEILKSIPVADPRLQIYFWRTQAGQEVDFLIERGRELVAIEVKWGHRVDETDLKKLESCTADLRNRLRFSVLLYGGTEVVSYNPKIIAIPFPIFFGVET